MKVLVTGGCGYIGSHTVIELIKQKYQVVIVDNLSNSSEKVVDRIEKISGIRPKFYRQDMLDVAGLENVFKQEQISDVIHFAGYKAVGESVMLPIKYFDNNLNSTINLLALMQKYNVKNLVFSSSATVYGDPKIVPIDENSPTGGVTNPYGRTKFFIEGILQDVALANPNMNISILRYFNPIGAHESGLIGENPNGVPNNLMPYITQVAVGKLPCLGVFGNDYKTIDGTGVRDYIHVVDLAFGHLAALKKMESNPGFMIHNLGTGKGTSVLELIHAFEAANGVKIPFVIKPRRDGDIDANYANCDKAKKELNWTAKYDIIEACKDSWNWQKKNPNGIE